MLRLIFPFRLAPRRFRSSWVWIGLLGLVIPVSGCSNVPQAEAQSSAPGAQQGDSAAVDATIAREGELEAALEYTGTTQPIREVSLRSQVEGRLLDLRVDVGDRIEQGEALAQLDDSLLTAALNRALADLAAEESEVASAQAEINDARTEVERARIELQQAQADAERARRLSGEGAIAQREAEIAQNQVRTAQQALRSAQAQVNARQQTVSAAVGRVSAQRSIVAQERERRSFTTLTAPISGLVLERVSEPGNLVQPGGEVLKLGDFSQVKVSVEVSELQLSNIQVGQPVQVRLDAFRDRTFQGQVVRISPAADPTARLIPVEVVIPNGNGQIGSGLLARVTFLEETTKPIVIPQSALEAAGSPERGSPAGGQAEQASEPPTGTIFVVNQGDQPTVTARSVRLGRRADGKVEVLSGLRSGETFVARSSRPLKDGETVRLSFLSETGDQR